MWQTRLVEYKKGMWPAKGLQVGDIFYGPFPHELEADVWRGLKFYFRFLSQFYLDNNADRRPLAIVVPGNHLFGIDNQCWNSELPVPNYGGWTVTGDPSNITMTPSINLGGLYHGFLTNGVLSDDVEHRIYDAEGYRVLPD